MSAELKAINAGLNVLENLEGKTCAVYSDSRAALQTISQADPQHPQAREIKQKLLKAHSRGNKVIICWIPSHCDILGNERADKLAKEATKIKGSWNREVYYKDLYAYIDDKIKSSRQKEWEDFDEDGPNNLQTIQPKLTFQKFAHFKTRLDETKFTRLRIGHTRLTHKSILQKGERGFCNACKEELTVEHFLLHCSLFNQARMASFGQQTFSVAKLLNRKNKSLNLKVISFLKAANIYKEI